MPHKGKQLRCVDVIFPLNLGPLTYSVEGEAAPGDMVSAEVGRTMRKGVVLKPTTGMPASARAGAIKPLGAVEGRGLSNAMLSLITWMAGYYQSPEGAVLKSILPREFFERVKARPRRLKAEPIHGRGEAEDRGLMEAGPGEADLRRLGEIRDNVLKRHYRTCLYHAASPAGELSFALQAASGMGGVILMCPDLARVKAVYGALRGGGLADRAVLYHSGLSKGARSEAIGRMLEGGADIVVGSRMAVFAPLGEVRLIVALQEESRAYKEEGGVRYSARDVAVMRGYLESATTVLASVCPSVESCFNAQSGKYTLMDASKEARRPAVRIIDARGQDRVISGRLRGALEAALLKKERVMLIANRAGYSMLRCDECGHMPACPKCSIPLLYHKAEKAIRCSYCAHKEAPPEACPTCGGTAFSPAGAGMERVREELMGITGAGLSVLSDTGEKIVVGTKGAARRAAQAAGFSLAAVINADSYMYAPDFRSAERAFQDFVYTSCGLKEKGEIFLQSRSPSAPLFGHMRKFDFKRFYAGELLNRKELNYPPFSSMALITVESTAEPPICAARGAEVLGPAPALTRRGRKVWKILIKSSSRKDLRTAIRAALRKLGGLKASLDIDPISV